MFHYSRDRGGGGRARRRIWPSMPGCSRPMPMADMASSTRADRKPGPILKAACWLHARRPFFVLADLAQNARRVAEGKTGVISPIVLEAVWRIEALFNIQRDINGQSAGQHDATRQMLSVPLMADLEVWMREQHARLSRTNDLARGMDSMLKRWVAFTRFLDDGRIRLPNNTAERALRGVALGRNSWLFAGSDRGWERAAAMYSLFVTAKLNDVDPQAWLADVLGRNWQAHQARQYQAA